MNLPVNTPVTPAGDTSAEHTRTTVAVLYGGQNTEHSVSCISAGAVISHLDPERYTIVPVGITRDGVWVKGTTDVEQLRAHGRELPEVSRGRAVTFDLGGKRGAQLRFGDGSLYAEVDVVFPVLHGVNGEDGTVQGLLELANVPYVGNGVFASATCMDKQYTKAVARHAGIPVGDEVIVTERRILTDEEKESLGLPVFVKPARGGSSIGISKVSDWEDFPAALETALAADSKVLVESMLQGPEVECGVLQYPDGTIQASYPSMLMGTEDGPEGFYGFDTKYLDDIITYEIPAPLPDDQVAEVRRLAVETFRALDCSGLARVDFFVTPEGPVLNEPNTMPGFTPISMYPKMFAASGVDYADLLDILIAQALAT
ncbi:D-alanine--D-alanine ligase family protein [Corynebacterium glyciniphilum]|uniref:D-alanine--D-alanine ligase n=1 Tax=Corynebacterium glyciniphilum AJ 3170 TaxID=1404245 RepID=X5DL93_9CORY|nr:D-alanine--D-alanine ligase family protein [Corynebacterium glyciniphilum]AHW63873.1 D-alanine-D-alanine ligase [Corynebacterium glyciniphilum AJ 3170]